MTIKESNRIAKVITRIALVVLIFLAATSCKTIQVVPEIHTEYVHDTISMVDSIYRSHYVEVKGDTIFQKDTIYEYKWRDKVVEVLKTDSVPYPVEVPKEVRKPNGWDRFCHWATISLFVALLLFVAYKLLKLYLRR